MQPLPSESLFLFFLPATSSSCIPRQVSLPSERKSSVPINTLKYFCFYLIPSDIWIQKKNLFTVYILERGSMSGGGAERETHTHNPKQAPGSELSPEPHVGLELTNHKIMT